MQPLDHKQLIPNQGNVWRQPKTIEYLDLVIASALMHGAKWSNADKSTRNHGAIKTLLVPISENPTWDSEFYWGVMAEKLRPGELILSKWYIHTVNHNEMVNYVRKWGVPNETTNGNS